MTARDEASGHRRRRRRADFETAEPGDNRPLPNHDRELDPAARKADRHPPPATAAAGHPPSAAAAGHPPSAAAAGHPPSATAAGHPPSAAAAGHPPSAAVPGPACAPSHEPPPEAGDHHGGHRHHGGGRPAGGNAAGRDAERGWRDLAGNTPSQVGVSGALRARDVARPGPEDLARAERELTIVRRQWQPPAEGR